MLLAKSKLNSIEILISEAFIDPAISHNELKDLISLSKILVYS